MISIFKIRFAGNDVTDVQLYEGNALWPGFRVAFFKKGFPHHVSILEPGFYWRVRRDYAGGGSSSSSAGGVLHSTYNVPAVTVLPLVGDSARSIVALEALLLSAKYHLKERILMHAPSPQETDAFSNAESTNSAIMDKLLDKPTLARLQRWADDSVGVYPDQFQAESERYGQLPSLGGRRSGVLSHLLANPAMAETVIDQVRLCNQVHNPNLGNRSCFDKCK